MLSREDNELLTRVGPGPAMGVVVPPDADWVPAATPRIVVRPGQALQRVATR
jgi:hypothetical protein